MIGWLNPSFLILGVLSYLILFKALPAFVRAWVRPDITLSPATWGKVYVLQDVRSPMLVKIGLTRRTAFIRSQEVSRDMTGGRPLWRRIVVHMPYAASVEAEAHRLMSRRRWVVDRGQEWFRVKDEQVAIRAVLRAARTVRRVARQRKRWSREADEDATVTLDSTRVMFPLCSHRWRSHAGRESARPGH